MPSAGRQSGGTFSSPNGDTASSEIRTSGARMADSECLSLTDESVSHEERDDRLAIHYFAPIDHTQCVLRGM